MADQSKPADTRTTAQIRADIAAARARIAANVEGLVEEVHPQAVRERVGQEARAFAQTEINNAKASFTSQVKEDDGSWRADRLVLLGGAIAGMITFLVTIRVLINRLSK